MMSLSSLLMGNPNTLTRFSPIVWNQIRKHHFQRILDANGIPIMKYLRPHTPQEAANLGVTSNFANRHVAEVHGNKEAALSPNQMADVVREVTAQRAQGAGLGKPETPKKNSVVAITPKSKAFSASKGVVNLNSPGVQGIGTQVKGQASPVLNNSVTVARDNAGQVNHLASSK